MNSRLANFSSHQFNIRRLPPPPRYGVYFHVCVFYILCCFRPRLCQEDPTPVPGIEPFSHCSFPPTAQRIDRRSTTERQISTKHTTQYPGKRFWPTIKCLKKRLVSEDGERNEWDNILDEQLSKCRPFQIRAIRRMIGNVESDGDRPPVATPSDEPVVMTAGREEEGVQKAEAAEKEQNEEEQKELENGVGDEKGGSASEGVEDKIAEGAPLEPTSSRLGVTSKSPPTGFLSGALQQQPQQQPQRQPQSKGEQQQQAAVRFSLAPQYAYLLSEACGSMLDTIHSVNVDDSVVLAVDTAAAAASAAEAAVAEATALLRKHQAELADGTRTGQGDRFEEGPGCWRGKSFSNTDARLVKEERPSPSPARVFRPHDLSASNPSSAGGGTLARMLRHLIQTGSMGDNGRSSGDECPGGVNDGVPYRGEVDEQDQDGKRMDVKANGEKKSGKWDSRAFFADSCCCFRQPSLGQKSARLFRLRRFF